MSANIYLFKANKRNTRVDVILMSLFLPLNIIHTIFESLLLTLNGKIFIQIASSDYETISIYIDFFQTKRCCQVHVQAALQFKIISDGMFLKETIFSYVQGMLDDKQLGLLRGIPHSPRCCRYVKSLYFHFVFT